MLTVFFTPIGFYYDYSTGFYYDATSQYYFNSTTQQYMYWDAGSLTYIPVDQSGQQAAEATTETLAEKTITPEPVAIEKQKTVTKTAAQIAKVSTPNTAKIKQNEKIRVAFDLEILIKNIILNVKNYYSYEFNTNLNYKHFSLRNQKIQPTKIKGHGKVGQITEHKEILNSSQCEEAHLCH